MTERTREAILKTGRVPAMPGQPAIAYEETGDGSVVLFLHGIGGNRTNWRAQLSALGGMARGVAWDARGYGDSDDPPNRLRFGDFAGDVVRLLDHLGADRAGLVGLSMGGRIALDVAAWWPDRVSGLMLCDTFRGFETLSADQREQFVATRRQPLLDGRTPADIADPVARSLVGPDADEATVKILIESISALRPGPYIQAIEAMVYDAGPADLGAITAPTLVVVGEHDRLAPPEVSAALAGGIAGARLAIIERAGHLANIERPDKFNRLMLEFLAGLDGPSKEA